jgi:2-polyprenyl-3-methyl-5-hydroxy-6-metoxy-1,4-benzoquinol methylase
MYVNAPRYLLRKRLVLKLLQGSGKGRCLDIGCGAGDLCNTVYSLGYKVKGIDFSPDAIQLCQELYKDIIQEDEISFSQLEIDQIQGTYDIIFMLEVLEHLEDDKSALLKIYEILKPNGYMILSVPAHQKSFGPSDVFAGHYRRYDKWPLLALLDETHFEVQTIWSYGFPLANLTEMIRNIIYANSHTESKEASSAQSGINRSVESRFRFLFNDFFLYPFYLTQLLFLGTNLGTGYLLKAAKR